MKKLLLVMVTLLGCLGFVRAAEASFTITFSTTSTSELNAKTLLSAVSEGKDYVTSFADLAKVYGGGTGKGIRLASSNSSSGTGRFTLNFSDSGKKKASKVVVNAAAYNSTTGSLKVGSSATGTLDIKGTTFADYEFALDANFEWSALSFEVAGNKRIYISSITVYYESDGPITEKTATPEISGETSFTDNTTVTITGAGAIYYTTDGTDPTTSSTAYNAPFTISETTTVKAIAQETGKDPSAVATATFTKKSAGDYVLVTSLGELDETASYIIGVADNNTAMSNASTSGNISQTSATIENGNLVPTDNVMTFKLVKDASGKWAFKAENYKGSNGPYIANSTTTVCKLASTASYFDVSLDDSHNNNIIIKSTGGRWIQGYNTQDFRNYSNSTQSGAKQVQLYRNGVAKVQAPEIALSSDKVKVGEKVTVTIDKKDAEKVYYTTDGTTPSASNGTEYTAPFEVTAEAVGEITITAVGAAEGKANSNPAKATISVSKAIPAMPEGKWRLVRKAEELIAGKYIIGVASNNRAMASSETRNSYIASVPATIKDGILTPDATETPMVFDLSGTEGAYTLAAYNYAGAGTYLTPADGTGVGIGTEAANLAITITQQKKAHISLASVPARWIQYNTGSNNDFRNYSGSSGVQVELYQLYDPSTVTACTTPVINVAKSELTAGESTSFTIDYEPGQQVRYTLDGSEPSATNGTVYNWEETVALNNLTATTTIKAIAYGEGMTSSDVATATVTVRQITDAPVIAPESKDFTGSLEVTITATEGDIYYTLDDTTPTEASAKYTGALTLTATTTVKAIAIAEGKVASPVVSATYTRVVPGMPVVTWTKDGVTYTAENDGTYEVYAGTRLDIVAVNGDKIKVTNLETEQSAIQPSPNYLTVNKDIMVSFASVNGEEVSAELTAIFQVVEKPAEKTYNLITSASQLKAGNKYVIAYKDAGDCVAVSNNGNRSAAKNQYRPVVRDGFTIDANNVLHDRSFGTADGTVGVMVFELGGSAGAWTLTADNYIKPADGVQNADEPAPGNQVKLHEFSKGYNFSMTTENSPLKITFEDNQAKITTTEMESAGYVVKFNSSSDWIGLSKMTNDYPMVQLYGYEPSAKPEDVVVTYTRTKDGEALATEDCGEYTAINESKITVSSKNATQIDVNGTKYDAVNGTYSFTTDVDKIFIVKGVNDAGETAEYTIEMLVDYEADNVKDMQTLSRKQNDRTNTNVWAPVKFIGSAFIRGHYMIDGGESETLWIEDGNGNATVIYELGDEFAAVDYKLEPGTMIKNFKVRSEDYYNATDHKIMELVSWPEDVENEVGTYDFAAWLSGLENAVDASGVNEFKLQKFFGDITFTATGATLVTTPETGTGYTVVVSNVLSFKTTGDKQSFSRTAEGSFNWLPGQEWLNGQTKNNAYVIGFVMPEGTASNQKYVVYPAQITDNAGNITGVDGVENDGDGVYVQGGVICAPAGSRVFGLNGAQVKVGQAVNGGVYVVVTPDGQAVKVLVK